MKVSKIIWYEKYLTLGESGPSGTDRIISERGDQKVVLVKMSRPRMTNLEFRQLAFKMCKPTVTYLF